jgi:hypothetical protein
MRTALYATGVMNVLAAGAFLPPAGAVRAVAGFPEGDHPLYLATVAMFVLLFGLGYLSAAVTGRADRLFLGVAAVGKLSFVALVASFWLAGALPPLAAALASADLPFGALFLGWLYTNPEHGARARAAGARP